jgi:arsenate reductase (thioredoxin)
VVQTGLFRQVIQPGVGCRAHETELAASATVRNWPVVGAERFAHQRLQALAHARIQATGRKPSVLFLCVHNAGRWQMALGWFTHLAGDTAVAWSGGSEAAANINSGAVTAMAEVGIDISAEFPKPWTQEFLLAADVVITMGCGDACPLLPGKRYEDWEIDDPEGKTIDEVRIIRDQIKNMVNALLGSLQPSVSG